MSLSVLSSLYSEDLYRISCPVIVVVAQPWEAYTEEDKKMLTKLIYAVQSSPSAVTVLHRTEFSLSDLKNFGPEKVLVFGTSPSDLKLNLHEPTPAQGFTVIRAEDLGELDETKKRSLWGGLKQMFNT